MKSNNVAVSAAEVYKTYLIDGSKLEVLKDITFEVENAEFTVLSGASGSGKTTLLNIISGIDKPSSGKIIVFGNELNKQNENFLAGFRCKNIGYVFQSYNLISTLTVAENVAFPMEWLERQSGQIRNRVEELLQLLGLQNRAEHFPYQLSGGEQQRVAFARALANDPPLFLVDEPTGNLDAKTSRSVIQILQRLKGEKKTVVVATHDERIFQLADRKLYLEDGRLAKGDE
jgi:putative ABC transport system ATP-binding protein